MTGRYDANHNERIRELEKRVELLHAALLALRSYVTKGKCGHVNLPELDALDYWLRAADPDGKIMRGTVYSLSNQGAR